jgi:hypothetical protein
MNSIKNNNKNDNTIRSTKKDASVTGRTLYYFGKATLGPWPYFLLDLLTSTGYAYFLTFGNPLIIARIIDRIGASQVTADQVFPVFGPHILALILCNVLGQVCSKLQDYSLWKLQILVYYDLSSMCFDVLANQSMTFHNNRYGGSLVSQTSKFTSAYNQLMQTLTYSVIPAAATVVFIIAILLPLVPLYVLIVAVFLVIYCVVVYHLFKRLQKLNAETAGAQNRLSGERFKHIDLKEPDPGGEFERIAGTQHAGHRLERIRSSYNQTSFRRKYVHGHIAGTDAVKSAILRRYDIDRRGRFPDTADRPRSCNRSELGICSAVRGEFHRPVHTKIHCLIESTISAGSENCGLVDSEVFHRHIPARS